MGVTGSNEDKILLGPKFKYIISRSILLSSPSSYHNAWYKYILPMNTRRQLHNKAAKLVPKSLGGRSRLAEPLQVDNAVGGSGGLTHALRARLSPLRRKGLAFILPNYNASKRIGPHNEDVISLLVGSLIGDCLAEREKSGGVRFKFKQSEADKDYIFWLYNFFNKRGYCTNNLPVLYKEGNKLPYTCYRFNTYTYTSLMWLYKLFYNHNKQKRMPKNIADLLTPLSLAVWICDVGGLHRSGVRLHIHSFKQEEIMLLSLALETKFNIKSTLHKNKDNFLLYIKLESMPLLKKLVLPYIIPSMRNKLGL